MLFFIVVIGPFWKVLDSHGDNKHPCLVPDFKVETRVLHW